MNTRSQDRALMRKMGEFAVVKLIGWVPRRFRRQAGRLYGNTAYRKLNWLPELIRTSGKKKGHPHPSVTSWVVKEFVKFEKSNQVEVPPVPPVGEGRDGEDVQKVQQ